MKLLSYKIKKTGSNSFGILTNNGIADIPANWPEKNCPQCLKDLLKQDDVCPDNLQETVSLAKDFINLDDVKLLPPIANPGKILALAGNYSEHIKECGLSLGLSDAPRGDTVPRPFIMPTNVLAGANDEIQWPVYSEQIDYEAELTIIIGKTAKCVSPADAKDYIAGFCVCNDVSARSITFKAGRTERPWDNFYDWLNGKWADGFLPIGPWITTADEIKDVQNLQIELKVNSQTRQKSNTSMMIYPANEIVSFLSHIMTLEPGDIICTGTPAGVGHATGNYLKAGDVIECQIETLGKLMNKMGPRPEKFYKPLE